MCRDKGLPVPRASGESERLLYGWFVRKFERASSVSFRTPSRGPLPAATGAQHPFSLRGLAAWRLFLTRLPMKGTTLKKPPSLKAAKEAGSADRNDDRETMGSHLYILHLALHQPAKDQMYNL
jgi:hypothetical protein